MAATPANGAFETDTAAGADGVDGCASTIARVFIANSADVQMSSTPVVSNIMTRGDLCCVCGFASMHFLPDLNMYPVEHINCVRGCRPSRAL